MREKERTEQNIRDYILSAIKSIRQRQCNDRRMRPDNNTIVQGEIEGFWLTSLSFFLIQWVNIRILYDA